MKVAIIGAGTSGLACAIELEKHGINPVIFERNSFIGEYHPHVSALLGVITRPIADPLEYLHKNFGIRLTPLSRFKKVHHISPGNDVEVSGNLGYFLQRGKEENSVKNQLYSQIRSEVRFNSFVQPEDIEGEFDFVVVADGHWTTPLRYGIWRETLKAWLAGGVFEGDFEHGTLKLWLDNELTKGVYIYCAPYDSTKAVIAHVVQDISREELNGYWHRFLKTRSILERYNMLESWEIPHHSGTVTTNRVGKIYFIGTAGGGVEPFLGFGQFNAVITGVMAARSIAEGSDINRLLGFLRKRSNELNRLRPLLNSATNRDLDLLMSVMKTPGLRSVVYRTNLDVIKILSTGLKIVFEENSQQAAPAGAGQGAQQQQAGATTPTKGGA